MPSFLEIKKAEESESPTLLSIFSAVRASVMGMFRASKPEENTELLKLSALLHTAMRYANTTCVLGASNRVEDLEHTSGWIYALFDIGHGFYSYRKYLPGIKLTGVEKDLNIASIDLDSKSLLWKAKPGGWILTDKLVRKDIHLKVVSGHPLDDKQFHLSEALKNMLICNRVAEYSHMANCHGRSDLVAEYLWRHANERIKTIEKIKMKSFDHYFIVVNRNGELLNPESWTEGYVIDPWYTQAGLIYPASTFQDQIEEIKAYCVRQYTALSRYGYKPKKYDPLKTEIDGLEYMIKPAEAPYPSYSPHKRTMDYYKIDDFKFEHLFEEDAMQMAHASRYGKTLDALKALNSSESRVIFFKSVKKKHKSTEDLKAQVDRDLPGQPAC